MPDYLQQRQIAEIALNTQLSTLMGEALDEFNIHPKSLDTIHNHLGHVATIRGQRVHFFLLTTIDESNAPDEYHSDSPPT